MIKIAKILLMSLTLIIATINSYCLSQPATQEEPGYRVPGQTLPQSQTQTAMPQMHNVNLGQRVSGDYMIESVAHQASGRYEWQNNQLVWVPAEPNTNIHFEVFLRDARSRTILPYSNVVLGIYDQNNRLVESKPMAFMWHPVTGYHYGNNFTVPATGNYSVRINATPPEFARANKALGNRWCQPVSVTYTNVRLMPMGQLVE
ncbi:MAG: hypothetical protein A2104_05100 [Candidatus Melainabacteria bacterium GWF2_32_7]|nr:MAG: hypothetical protein A2104_05100 [Candidatus Melainabacteria bacterium GWF2_32_7]